MNFIFTRTDSPVCRLVRAVDGGEWSHCAVASANVSANATGATCYEAVWPQGVRCRQLAGLLMARPSHISLSVPMPDEEAAERWLIARVGLAYDWPAIPALAIRRIFGAAPPLARQDRWYCAELLLGACSAGGAPIDGPLRRHGVAHAFEHVQRLAAANGSKT